MTKKNIFPVVATIAVVGVVLGVFSMTVMGDESIGRAAIEKIELAWQADPSKFRVDKKQNRLIYSYPPDGPWYELKYIADELPNSLEAEISGGNQLIMNYEQAQELFGIKFRRWLGIFNL